MPSKKNKGNNESKKSMQKKKEKILEDKTFGMKNKNKSKKVQNYITSVTNNVMNSGDPKQRKLEEQRRQAKANAKARKKAAEEERNALFGEALMAVKKKKSTNQTSGRIEAKGRDGDDENKKSGTSRAMKMMYQMDAKEVEDQFKNDPNYVRTIEDEIEKQRQDMFDKLKKSGKKGTPVTESTFNAWLEAKRKKRAAEAKKKVEAEMRKKAGGKGLSVLSGRDLYTYNKDLFVDDEAATNVNDINVNDVSDLAENVQSDLFLDGNDDDLDDLDED